MVLGGVGGISGYITIAIGVKLYPNLWLQPWLYSFLTPTDPTFVIRTIGVITHPNGDILWIYVEERGSKQAFFYGGTGTSLRRTG